MDPDLFFIIGIVLAVLSLPSMISAFSEGRAPRVATFTAVVAGCMIVYAIQTNPEGYTFKGIPEVFVRVVARII